MTLEEALQENIRLSDELKKLNETNAALTKGAETAAARIEQLQNINQQYYLRITSPSDKVVTGKEDSSTEIKTVEDFAASVADKF
jgi:protein-disulfide isomerase